MPWRGGGIRSIACGIWICFSARGGCGSCGWNRAGWCELENQILGVEREGDLPGEMIPYYYFEYVRTQQALRLVPIFHHNAIDILSLACLTAIVPQAFQAPEETGFRHGADLIGLARWLLRSERHDEALRLFRRAVDLGLPDHLLFQTMWETAVVEKRLGRMRGGAGGLHGSGGVAQSLSGAGARRGGEVLRAQRAELRDGAGGDAQRAGYHRYAGVAAAGAAAGQAGDAAADRPAV